ncbi:MAG: acyltransferase, partial [Cytophagaceae bacterium]
MGLLKVLLAALVVFVHAGPLPGFPTMGGSLAVQTFYVISGFYMALILNEKYVDQPHAYRLFLTNRVLRLLPIYYVVVGLTLLTALVMTLTLGEPKMEFFQAIRTNYDRLAASTISLLAFVNLTLIGQDWLSFLTINPTTGT